MWNGGNLNHSFRGSEDMICFPILISFNLWKFPFYLSFEEEGIGGANGWVIKRQYDKFKYWDVFKGKGLLVHTILHLSCNFDVFICVLIGSFEIFIKADL